MSKAIFITGTSTDIGKTYVSALLVKKLCDSGYDTGYFKAVVSGNEWKDGTLIPGDADFVKRIAGIGDSLTEMVPYVYQNAVSPHLASRLEGNPVKMNVIKEAYDHIYQKHDYIVMEGSGGILCPICYDEQEIWLEDIVKELQLDSLIIADAGLGTINSVVLTVEYMRQKQMHIKGIILNHYHPGNLMEEDNIRMIEHRTGIPIIACVQEGDKELIIEHEKLVQLF